MNSINYKTYPTDLTDAQWAILEPLVPPCKHGGRPRIVDMRKVINTILYLNRTGCQRLSEKYSRCFWDFMRRLGNGTQGGYWAIVAGASGECC